MSLWLCLLLLQTPDFLDQGRKALDALHNEEAAASFRKAVEAAPGDYAAHFHLALAQSLLQHDDDAIGEYRKTLELKPGLRQAELNLGIVLLRDQKAAEAIPLLQAAAEAKPDDVRANLYLGEALLKSGNAADAAAAFETALKTDERSARSELGFGHALLAQKDFVKAEIHLRKAAALDPQYAEAPLEVAEALEQNGRPAEALVVYRSFPDNAAAQSRLGELLLDTDQVKDAIPRLEAALKASPTVENRLALATAYRKSKETVKELEQLAKTVEASPARYDLRMFYGRALRDERQLVPAANQFYAAAKLKPESKEAWNELATVLLVHQDYQQGLAALDKVKELGGETAGNYFLRAITLDKLHQLPQALASYRAFLNSTDGRLPDHEFQARQRMRIIEDQLNKR